MPMEKAKLTLKSKVHDEEWTDKSAQDDPDLDELNLVIPTPLSSSSLKKSAS